MIALRWKAADAFAVEDVPEPKIRQPEDVKVRVGWAAVCASDLQIIKGAFGLPAPRTLGHEVAGVVEEVGPAVRALRPGDRVVVQPTIFCNTCPPCEAGHWHLCPNRRFVGIDVDGGFAEVLIVPEVNLIRAPASTELRELCLGEPLACVLHAVEEMRATAASRVVITGAGTSAYLFVQALVSIGAAPGNILVSGRRDRRLKIMKEAGARVVDVRTESFGEAVREHFGASGPDFFIDQVGDPALLWDSLDQLARKGTLFLYDYMGDPIAFDFGRMLRREIKILASTGCAGETLPRAVELIASSQVDLRPLMTHTYKGESAADAVIAAQGKNQKHVKSFISYGAA